MSGAAKPSHARAERTGRASQTGRADETGRADHHPQDADLSVALRAAQAGDEQAFRLLFREVQPRLLRYLRAIVADDAEDVASEAWLQIARDIRSFSGDFDSFRGWAATIARHRALDHLRSRQRRPASAVPVEALADRPADEDTAERALAAVSADAAVALIASLPRDQAEAVLLRVVMGLDAEAAGHVLGKRAGAVRTAAYRGLKRLARHFEETGASTALGVTRLGPAALKDMR
jgi:RNA polymerase sigma-70 factor, ECF subfamily